MAWQSPNRRWLYLGCWFLLTYIPGASSSAAPPPRAGCLTAEWCIETVPRAVLGPSKVLTAAGGQSVWAVGPHGSLRRRSGDSWVEVDCRSFATISHAWADTPNNVWLFGEGGTILHFDGQRCAAADSGTSVDLHSAWGASGSDIWAVGAERTVLHFDGARWTRTQLGAPQHASQPYNYQIAGTGPRDVWILAEAAADPTLSDQPLWHFDGAAWRRIPVALEPSKGQEKAALDSAPVRLSSLWVGGPAEVWLAGVAHPYQEHGYPVILRGGPSRWREVSAGGEKETRYDWVTLHGQGLKDLWLSLGYGDGGASMADCARWNGKGWSAMRCPADESIPPLAFDAVALRAGKGHELFLLGTERRGNDGPDSIFLRWDGHAWSPPVTVVENRRLQAMWGSGAALWAVGEGGEIQHYDGQDWTGITNDDTNSLHAVWGAGPGDVWAVGDRGTILHLDDKRVISRVNAGSAKDLLAVWGNGPRDIWVAGRAGTLLHFDGNRFQAIAASSIVDLLAIDGRPGDVWVGGQSGVLLHVTSAGVMPIPFVAPAPSSANQAENPAHSQRMGGDIVLLKRRTAQELWIATPPGTDRSPLWRFDGAVFSPHGFTDPRRTGSPIISLVSTSDGELWALGPHGALYRYRPAKSPKSDR